MSICPMCLSPARGVFVPLHNETTAHTVHLEMALQAGCLLSVLLALPKLCRGRWKREVEGQQGCLPGV